MSQLLRFATVPNLIYLLFLIWIIVSIRLIRRTIKGSDVNEYFYSSIPNVFTTIGILGTFVGIYIGLQGFETSDINSSIPILLEGLKSAFLTSIMGIVLSLIFGRLSELAIGFAHSTHKSDADNELQALNTINQSLANLRNDFLETNIIFKEQKIELQTIASALASNGENGLLSQLEQIRTNSNDNFKSLSKNIEDSNKELQTIGNALISEEENSLLSQVKQIRVDSNMNFESLTHYLDGNKKDLHEKFQEFAQLLADNNTEALVEVMKSATEEFNGQMSSLINKLVQENFSELNTSVKKLNDWQVQNKEMVSELTKKHKETVDQFEISAKAIQNVSSTSESIVLHVKELVNEKSKLHQLVEALNKVLVEDERFENSTKNLLGAIGKVEKNIDAFDKTTHRLNDWVEKEHSVKDSINALLIKLDEISNIKSYNGQFWDETKKQLNEGTQLITNNTEMLSSSLDGINQEFQNQLGEILGSLDELIQRLIIKAKDN